MEITFDNSFDLAMEKILNADVTNMCWSNTMDLLAIILRSHTIEVSKNNINNKSPYMYKGTQN